MNPTRLVPSVETSERLGVKLKTLLSRPYRTKIGLPACRIGGRVMFREKDLEALIQRGMEKLPGRPKEAQDVAD